MSLSNNNNNFNSDAERRDFVGLGGNQAVETGAGYSGLDSNSNAGRAFESSFDGQRGANNAHSGSTGGPLSSNANDGYNTSHNTGGSGLSTANPSSNFGSGNGLAGSSLGSNPSGERYATGVSGIDNRQEYNDNVPVGSATGAATGTHLGHEGHHHHQDSQRVESVHQAGHDHHAHDYHDKHYDKHHDKHHDDGHKPSLGDKVSGTLDQIKGTVTKNEALKEEGRLRKQGDTVAGGDVPVNNANRY